MSLVLTSMFSRFKRPYAGVVVVTLAAFSLVMPLAGCAKTDTPNPDNASTAAQSLPQSLPQAQSQAPEAATGGAALQRVEADLPFELRRWLSLMRRQRRKRARGSIMRCSAPRAVTAACQRPCHAR